MFVAAFAASAALPGPDTMLLFSCALGSGARAAAPIAVGLTLGKLMLLSAAVAGVIVAASTLGPVFIVLKVAGGAYLVWMAIGLWRRAGNIPESSAIEPRVRQFGMRRPWRSVGAGVILTIANPQALLFYAVVLPSVLGPGRVGIAEYAILCTSLAVVMAGVSAAYITLGTRATSTFSNRRHRMTFRIGAIVLGLSAAAVVTR